MFPGRFWILDDAEIPDGALRKPVVDALEVRVQIYRSLLVIHWSNADCRPGQRARVALRSSALVLRCTSPQWQIETEPDSTSEVEVWFIAKLLVPPCRPPRSAQGDASQPGNVEAASRNPGRRSSGRRPGHALP